MEESGTQNAERETNAERAGTKTDTEVSPANHFVYVMISGPPSAVRTKIGNSCCPEARRQQLSQGSAFEVHLRKSWIMSRSDALYVEGAVKDRLRAQRAHGEWFNCTEADVAAEVEAAIARWAALAD